MGSEQPALPPGAGGLDNELWRFACAFYARGGVAAACLALQDRLGVDVPLLLAAMFAAVRRRAPLAGGELAALDAEVRDWRSEVITALRRLRIRLKAGPLPAPSAATDRLRALIAGAERDAEQIELAVVLDWLDRRPPQRPAGELAADEVLRAIVFHYARGAPATDVGDALRALGEALGEAEAEERRSIAAQTEDKGAVP